MRSKIIDSASIYNEKLKIWTGKTAPRTVNNGSSIGKVVLECLLKHPDHIAQICYQSGREFTNREIATLAIRVSQHFNKMQVKQGDIIGINASNSDYIAPLVFGALLSGLTISTLDPSFDKDGIKHTFSITNPIMMFCDGSIYNTVHEALNDINSSIPIYTMREHIAGVLEFTEFLQATGDEERFKPVTLQNGCNQTAAILCSSGTTGLPKGVCMSHMGLLNPGTFAMVSTDKYLCFSTLYWISGLYSLLTPTYAGSTRIISEKPFNTEDFFDIVKKYRVTYMMTPPSQLALSLASAKVQVADLSSVEAYLCGGSAVSPTLISKMEQFMPNCTFIVGYGMSEICGVGTFGYAEDNGSVGQLADNTEMKIIDNDGNHLGPNEYGEICIRPPFLWPGYYDNKEATDAIYRDGWIHSGDLGYIDEKGNVFIVDRIKDIMKYNNFHFFPTEIENVIMKLPGVSEVCVCGIPDVVSTHLPAAAIVKTQGSALTEADVINYVAENMTHFKHLRGGVYFLNEMPRTASGKSLRRAVASICEKMRNVKNQITTNGN